MSWQRGILGLIVIASLAAFPWGPLFAWSPVHPGYREARFSRADVLYPDSAALDPAYREVDRYVAVAENFHELKCPRKIKVVVCRNWGDCLRFAAPFLMGQRPLAVTVPTGTVIFVTPRADGWADIGGLLRHELSHAVQNQNRSLLSVLRMLRQPWVSEGVAGVVAAMGPTAPARHLVSLPEAEFVSRAKTEDLWSSFSGAPQKDWQFSYTARIYFWDREIERNGKGTFLRFERACFSDPGSCRNTFAGIYRTDLRSAVEEFQAEVRSGRLVPPERIRF
ncbi:MAG TPA: hypothetical protein VMI94_09780 [Bryobacteraceae bacterium]|nr:hypothetical protein [Bryobacteraceae bacterium]